MKHLNFAPHIVWATLIMVALLAYAGCYNDAPNPWYNSQENAGGNSGSDKVAVPQQDAAGGSTLRDPNYKEGYAVKFLIPATWRYNMEGSNSADQLLLDQPSSDGVKPYVMMDLYWAGLGDDAKAKTFAMENENRFVPWTDKFTNKEYNPYFKEMEVNGTKIHIAGDINISWGTPSWSEEIWFSRDGVVYNIVLDDVVDKHLDAVKTVVDSIRRKD